MKTLILHHDDCLAHDPGSRHAESAARVKAVLKAVRGLPGTETLPAPKARIDQVEAAHDPDHWQDLVDRTPADGRYMIDGDTGVSPGSIDAALRASGAACFAVDQVLAGRARSAFCATRPPGHHAEAARAMGFCLSNHAAVAAMHAFRDDRIRRVAIVDFDVHHGNGTQAIFEQDPRVMYISSHQSPLYPGTGRTDEVGCGNILNMPLPPGTNGVQFRDAWRTLGLPALHGFQPDLLLVSAGFDAHERDPLAQIDLLEDDFSWITTQLKAAADDGFNGRLISILEGGYDIEALGSSAGAHVEALTH